MSDTTKVTMYLHGNKESNYDLGQTLNFANEEAENNFMYALYEVEFEVEVDLATGDTTILKVNKKELK